MTHEMFITKKKVTYTSKKDGQQKTAYNFYLHIDDNISIAIRPSFDGGYTLLKAFAIDEPEAIK